MSDHVDGPRSIGEPTADLTDLFAFTSPENPARTILAACVFPAAGENAIFSNVIDYSIAVRPVTVAGTGNAAKFQPANEEIGFTFRFEVLKRDVAGRIVQNGVCTLPGGRELALIVNDEKGASTPERDFRFAGLRSDPFYLAWIAAELKKVPNLLQHNNVLAWSSNSKHAERSTQRKARYSGQSPRPSRPPAGRPHRTSSRTHRLGRTPRADERSAQQPGLSG